MKYGEEQLQATPCPNSSVTGFSKPLARLQRFETAGTCQNNVAALGIVSTLAYAVRVREQEWLPFPRGGAVRTNSILGI
jgi:hypothetical protein